MYVRNMAFKYTSKGAEPIKDLLLAPSDKDHITKKSGIIYRYKCGSVECNEEYIGESSRTFGEKFREGPIPSIYHFNITGHNTTLDNFSIVGRKDQNLMRFIQESIYIRVNNPSPNKNVGKYNLLHVWDEVLFNSSELKIK